MYRVIHADGQLHCSSYEFTDHGVELFTQSGAMCAFVPFEALHVIIDDDVEREEEDTGQAVQ